jgi:vacuolar-type H+-ATPase subunit H
MAKKIILGVVVFLLLLIGAVVTIPFIFKDEINASVKLEINKQLNAKVDYGDFDLSLIRSFPNFSFQMKNLSVVGVGDFKGDTLAFLPEFSFTIDLMSIINKEKYRILKINLQSPTINAKITKDGKENWDIMKESDGEKTAAESENFSFEIKKYSIENANITFDDQKGKTLAIIKNLNFEGSGDVTEDVYDFMTKTTIDELTYRSGLVSYLSKAKITGNNTISIDQKNNKYSFANNEISVNDLGLQFDGFTQINEKDMDLDIKFKSKEASFKSILSLIPAIYKKDFDKIKTSGSLKLEGIVKGKYADENFPSFKLDLKVLNAMFQYPSLPTAVSNINIDMNIDKGQGSLDKMFINISKLHADIGAEPIDAKIKVSTPISNPNVDMDIKGKLNLANIQKFYPMEGIKKLSGIMIADLTFKGKQSDVDNKNFNAIKADGNLSIANLVYESNETPMPINVSDIKMQFNPQNITLTNLAAKIGKSDYKMSGTLENFIAYAFNQGDLKGSLNLVSNYFDANEWLKTDNQSQSAESKAESEKFFQVPANIDFTANAKFGKILYEKINLTNVTGNVKVKDETIFLNDLFANALGGSARITASYSTAKTATPKVDFNYDIKNFDFKQTYSFVGMADKLAPIMKYAEGSFSSDLKGSGSLTENMDLDYNSLKGEGKVEIVSARISNVPLLDKIAEVSKVSSLKNLAINNAWTLIKFKDGKVEVEPTDIKFGNGYNVNLSGKNGFDQSIDYIARFDVPSKELGGATNYLTGMMPKIPGVDFKLPDVLSLFMNIGGTMAKPTVKLAKVGSGGTGGGVKDMISNTFNDIKGKAEDEARKQADIAKQRAEEEAQKLKQQAEQRAKEEADKIKKQAEQRAKEEADKVKKDVENKAKDALKGFKFPR